MLLLLLLLLLPAADAAADAEYFDEVPQQYRRRFLAGDRFSAIVSFVRDARRNASAGRGCPGRNRTRFPLDAFRQDDEPIAYAELAGAGQAAVSVANLVGYAHQLARRPFRSWFADESQHQAFWYSLASSVVASDRRVFGCYVALFNDADSEPPAAMPHAFRNDTGHVVVGQYRRPGGQLPGFRWLRRRKDLAADVLRRLRRRPGQRLRPDPADKIFPFSSDIMRHSGVVKVVTDAEAFWSPPVFVCPYGRWLLSYAVPFPAGSGSALSIRGWIVTEIDLRWLEINQCANDSTFRTFYSNNPCNKATTECVHISGQGFTDTNFQCRCKRFFFHGNFSGEAVRPQFSLHLRGLDSNYSNFECGPCPSDCPASCTSDGRCRAKFDLDTLRALPLIVQTFCLTVCLLVAGIVFRTRRNRVIKSSVWILLEIFLLGVSLLYITVFLMYLRPNYIVCFVTPWLREVGFAITYGTLIVKVYRILCSFQSRKAHRVHVRDRDLLKYLAGVVALAVGFMAAWTAATLDHGRRLAATLTTLNCSDGLRDGQLILEDASVGNFGFRVCAIGHWDAVCAVGELAFLVFGLFYCYCVRSAPADFAEVRCITLAFVFELLVSLCYHIARHFLWNSLHPDYLYLMYFARCHLTVTVTAALVIGPKLWYVHSPPKNSLNNRSLMYSQVDSHFGDAMAPMAITANGDLDALEINLTDMNPEDIRAELKRLYTQLEIFKTKVMRKENPHISKRRGGRKQTHRRFSLTQFKHSHKQHQPVQEEEASKVSEESSNSAEGQEERAGRSRGN